MKYNKPYHETRRKLENEFWADARKELGYTEWLNEVGVSILEEKARTDGHSVGFPELFNRLRNLAEFSKNIADNIKLTIITGEEND